VPIVATIPLLTIQTELPLRGAGSFSRWLPDGQRLLATSGFRVRLVDTKTKEARELYADPGRQIGTIVLSPDARRLYFTSFVTASDMWAIRFRR
jgi:Tol biopolymer transport system component